MLRNSLWLAPRSRRLSHPYENTQGIKVTDSSLLPRLELLQPLTEAAVRCAEQWGKDEKIKGVPCPVRRFTLDTWDIIYRKPSALAPGTYDFGVDIWVNGKKHFSSRWSSTVWKDYELVSLVRGPWIPQLLHMVAATPQSSGLAWRETEGSVDPVVAASPLIEGGADSGLATKCKRLR